MIGTTIAIRYSVQRPQFGDKLIMDYLSHQRRLLPGLAVTYALQLGMKKLKVSACSCYVMILCFFCCVFSLEMQWHAFVMSWHIQN